VIEQAEGGLRFAKGFPLLAAFSPAFLAAFESAFRNQLLGGAGVAQRVGGNVHVHHDLLKGEGVEPLHQDRNNGRCQIWTARE
jgi:hypothetical protein